MIVLNNDQQNKLIQQYVELVVDNMDRKTMEEWITDELIIQYGKLQKPIVYILPMITPVW